jgi:hypothetical protein
MLDKVESPTVESPPAEPETVSPATSAPPVIKLAPPRRRMLKLWKHQLRK